MSKETINKVEEDLYKQEEKKNLKETIYDKIDIPLHKLDRFIITMVILTIAITLFASSL